MDQEMPKLMIKVFGDPGGEICELEEASNYLNFESGIIVVEGQNVYSYDDLVQIASQEKYRNKEYIEVSQIPPIEGG
jgi:hypothetical protein